MNIEELQRSLIPKTIEGRAKPNRARPNFSGASGAKVVSGEMGQTDHVDC